MNSKFYGPIRPLDAKTREALTEIRKLRLSLHRFSPSDPSMVSSADFLAKAEGREVRK